jgi:hypothetical protein
MSKLRILSVAGAALLVGTALAGPAAAAPARTDGASVTRTVPTWYPEDPPAPWTPPAQPEPPAPPTYIPCPPSC